jgi:hypothetical protein
MVEVGQITYEHFRLPKDETIYYRLGVVIKKFDNVFFFKLKRGTIISCFLGELKDEVGEGEIGTMILRNNGEPVYAKKNIFGRYKI